MDVGFIGLGAMGGPMAARFLDGGHRLIVHDVNEAAAAALIAKGAEWAASPRELAARAETVFASLPGPAEMQAVALGAEGIIAGLRPGGVFIDLTTNSPNVVREVAKVFADAGLRMLDAPVSGGIPGAAHGKLAIWVGGDAATFERVAPLMALLGAATLVGDIGAGCATKLVHNMASMAWSNVAAEVVSLGLKAGLEPAQLFAALRQSAMGRARPFDGLAGGLLSGDHDKAGFALRLAYKDVLLATQLGRELQVPMRLSNAVADTMTEGMNRGWGARNHTAVQLLQMEKANVSVEPVDGAVLAQILSA